MIRNIIVQQVIPHPHNSNTHHHHHHKNNSIRKTTNYRYKLCVVDFSWAVSHALQDSDRPGKEPHDEYDDDTGDDEDDHDDDDHDDDDYYYYY